MSDPTDDTNDIPNNSLKEDLALVPDIASTELDLTKDEKLRTTALMLAINYYKETLIKDAGMYQQIKLNNGYVEQCSYKAIVDIAFTFEDYIKNGLLLKDNDIE